MEETGHTLACFRRLIFIHDVLTREGPISRISPYEWAKPHPCKDEVEEMETNMNLHNSIWHNCGSLMQQGSDIAPK